MSGFRQQLSGMLRGAVQGVLNEQDQQYARQLASMLERYSLILRAYHGGEPLWSPHLEIVLRHRRKKRSEKEQENGN